MKKKLSFLALSLSLCAVVTVLAGASTKTAVHETPGPQGIQSNLMAVFETPGPEGIVRAEPMVAVFETPGPHGIVVYKG